MAEQLMGFAMFFCGSIFLGLGVIVITLAILAVNNLLHRYWKELNWKMFKSPEYIYIQEQVEPTVDQTKKSK